MPNVVEVMRDNSTMRRQVRNLRILAPLLLVAGFGLGWHAHAYRHAPRPVPVAHLDAAGCALADVEARAELERQRDFWRDHSRKWDELAHRCVNKLDETERALSWLLERRSQI